jgi:hypothetical protein
VIGLGGLFTTTPNLPHVGAARALMLPAPDREIRGGVVRSSFPDEGIGVESIEVGEGAGLRPRPLFAKSARSAPAPEQSGPRLSAWKNTHKRVVMRKLLCARRFTIEGTT